MMRVRRRSLAGVFLPHCQLAGSNNSIMNFNRKDVYYEDILYINNLDCAGGVDISAIKLNRTGRR